MSRGPFVEDRGREATRRRKLVSGIIYVHVSCDSWNRDGDGDGDGVI